MLRIDVGNASDQSPESTHLAKHLIGALSILVGLSCLAGFIVASIEGNANSVLINQCENDTQHVALCFVRLISTNALRTEWDRYLMVTLLLTYASVFLHLIVESTRTNVSGLLGQMIVQTVLVIVGIGVCFPIVFVPSFIYFYKSKKAFSKSPVPIDILCAGLVYIVCMIIVPTYLIYFLPSHKLLASIVSLVLLVSPLGFALISLPFRLFSGATQRCWIINSHRLIVHCQVILFILSAPLFFIVLVSLVMHGSFELIKRSYVTEITNAINPITCIWSVDYLSLFVSLILFIIVNEYLFHSTTYRTPSSKIKLMIGCVAFAVVFVIAPCLAFPLYVAWREYQYLRLA